MIIETCFQFARLFVRFYVSSSIPFVAVDGNIVNVFHMCSSSQSFILEYADNALDATSGRDTKSEFQVLHSWNGQKRSRRRKSGRQETSQCDDEIECHCSSVARGAMPVTSKYNISFESARIRHRKRGIRGLRTSLNYHQNKLFINIT